METRIQYCETCGTLVRERKPTKHCNDCSIGKIKRRFTPGDSGRLPICRVTALLKVEPRGCGLPAGENRQSIR